MGGLTGKVAFVTGAARGQGRAEAVRLAADGADIIAVDIAGPAGKYVRYEGATRDDLDTTVKLVEAEGRRVIARQADVRRLDQLQAAVDEGVRTFGRLDVVVANAGIRSSGRAWELAEDQWQEMLDTNLTGVWKTVKATIPTLIEQGQGGSIIITSSVAGLRGLPLLGHYAAAEHGLVGLTRTLATELGAYDIRVNSVHPHRVNTPMGNDQTPKPGPVLMPALPYDTVEPEDIASIVSFLASDEGRFLTGAQLPVDLGGLTR